MKRMKKMMAIALTGICLLGVIGVGVDAGISPLNEKESIFLL